MMTWIGETEDGEQVHLSRPPQAVDGAFVRVARSRHTPDPRGTETYDFDRRRWVVDPTLAATLVDRDHVRDHGARSIDLAHWAKAIEATLMLAGLPVDGGLIAAEAEATGQDPMDLARIVRAKSAPLFEAEAARIAARRKIADNPEKA